MAGYDRPSWKDIDRARDGSAGRRKKREDKKELREHSTRYDKYKADLNRLFDQGLAGELLKKMGKKDPQAEEPERGEEGSGKAGRGAAKRDAGAKAAVRRKGDSRIPKDAAKSSSRLKLIRSVIDAGDRQALIAAIDALVEGFGLPDDWEVLVRVLEHPDQELVCRAVTRMSELLPQTAKVPRRASLKERLRTIGQTSADAALRQLAEELSVRL